MSTANNIVRTLTALTELIARADNEWVEVADHGETGDDQYLRHMVRVAYYAMLGFLDQQGLHSLAGEVRRALDDNRNNLLRGEPVHALGEARLATTDVLREIVQALQQTDPAATASVAFEPSVDHAVRILRNAKLAAARTNAELDSEAKLDRFCESLLVSSFPDLNSSPALTLANSYRQPDTEIASISALIEYKYLANKDGIARLIDGLQADVRNYARHGWRNLVILVGQAEWFLTEDNVKRDLLSEPSSFDRIEVIVERM
jgi:hypothetical protein